MLLKGQFISANEEGYALDAFTSDKLRDLGMVETARDTETGDRYYTSPGIDNVRLVRTAGSAKHGIVDFGKIVREVRDGEEWKKQETTSLEDFVNKPYALQSAQVVPLPGLHR